MEKRDFDLFLNRALDSGIPVELVGSHRHTSIKALMRSEYKDLGVEKSQSQIKSLISQKNIALIPRPPKEDPLAWHVSRFGKN